MVEIAQEEKDNVIEMFRKTVDEEKAWAEYLFKEGSMIGLNAKLLSQYVEWIANRRMKALGLDPIYDIPARNNPLPWTQYWLNSKGQQNAPQETEIESYVVGGIKQDIKNDTFAGFTL
jgi:ribonucleotide reductase beta subunit family protein with ferritin-like domain